MPSQPAPQGAESCRSEGEKAFLKSPSMRRVLSVRDYIRTWPLKPEAKLMYECFAEFWGTMMIAVFGVGSVNTAIAVGAHSDLWHVAMIWGFGVSLAIYCTASVSGAHLNPAVSLAFAMFRGSQFPWSKLGWYWLAQMAGGVAGGAMNFLIFFPYIGRQERLERLEDPGFSRGGGGSEISAMVFGEYYPAPDWVRGNELEGEDASKLVSTLGALCVEAWGTGILMFVIMALTDDKQKVLIHKEMVPFMIGFTVAVLIGCYAPLTQAGWNPARDFGPRLVAAMAGWGKIAIPGPRNGFWVYILGPMLGAPLGAFAYVMTIEPGLRMAQ
ncbi:unnamed protein product [Ostreobium quekettii]|uniref:Aquaporin n=1 Tax=Ostreobium quekettii TaxID=121088 RepID=A0A8S1JCQ3_9CHLO|nr:unnamed protein product [Ostreobium quekettii]|eukprot:evm.model.scf_442.2 EVM.evm.TU.scf_442.2   scf_442:8164-9144(+)